jgi:hypothetical protein
MSTATVQGADMQEPDELPPVPEIPPARGDSSWVSFSFLRRGSENALL